MNSNLVIMVVMIVAIVFGSGIFNSWMKIRREELKRDTNNTPDPEQEKRIADLEERVKTLERIATSKSERLSREISDL